MMIRSIATISRVPKETPTPMPALSADDNEDGGLGGDGLGKEDVAGRLLGPAS
jgi:hypothetical protein